MAALYRRVEVGLFSSRTKAHKSLQALQGAARNPHSIEYLVYRAAHPARDFGAGQTAAWRLAMEEALDSILAEAKPSQLAIVGPTPFPRPSLPNLNLGNLRDLYLRVGRQNPVMSKIFGRLVAKALPGLRSLSLDGSDLLMPISEDYACEGLSRTRLQKLEIPWQTAMSAGPAVLPNPAHVSPVMNLLSAILLASSDTLRYLDLTGLQRKLAPGTLDWTLELSQLKCLTDLHYMLHGDEGAWSRQLAGLRLLPSLTRVTAYARYEGTHVRILEAYLELVLQLLKENRMPTSLRVLDCTQMRHMEESSNPALFDFYSRRRWYNALRALEDQAKSINLRICLFASSEVQHGQLIGLCLRERIIHQALGEVA